GMYCGGGEESTKASIDTREGKLLLFRVSDCESSGVRRNTDFRQVRVSAPFEIRDDDLINVLNMIGRKCYKKLKGSEGNAMTCLRGSTLCARLDDETIFFNEKGERVGDREFRDRPFAANRIVIRIESVFACGETVTIQMKLHEVHVKPKVYEEDSDEDY
ncbi:Hypothetical predicted protein, partial [Paramuricea clavata]